MKAKKAAVQGSNNNIEIIYINKERIYFNINSISKKLDFITISIYNDQYVKQLYSFLEANRFKAVSDYKLKKGNYSMKRTYKSDTDIASVEIMHSVSKPFPRFPSLLIKIHDPNEELLSLLDSFFKYHRIEVKVSVIEMTFDFFTDDRIRLFEFLKSHLFHKNRRIGAKRQYYNTFYTSDRKSAKGMKVYLHRFDKKIVRLELTLKRSIIRSHGLGFPLSNVDSVDLSKFFSFKYFNKEKIKNYLYWINRSQIENVEEMEESHVDIVKAQLNSWLYYTIERNESLLENLDVMKSKKIFASNYSRFLEPLDWFNSDFFEFSSNTPFIQSKHKLHLPSQGWFKNMPVSSKKAA